MSFRFVVAAVVSRFEVKVVVAASRRVKPWGIDFTFNAERHLYLVRERPVPRITQALHSAELSADYSHGRA